jgi:hypothetical protein
MGRSRSPTGAGHDHAGGLRASNTAASQVIIHRIGLKRERQWLDPLGYGNRQVGTRGGPVLAGRAAEDPFGGAGPFMERLAACS